MKNKLLFLQLCLGQATHTNLLKRFVFSLDHKDSFRDTSSENSPTLKEQKEFHEGKVEYNKDMYPTLEKLSKQTGESVGEMINRIGETVDKKGLIKLDAATRDALKAQGTDAYYALLADQFWRNFEEKGCREVVAKKNRDFSFLKGNEELKPHNVNFSLQLETMEIKENKNGSKSFVLTDSTNVPHLLKDDVQNGDKIKIKRYAGKKHEKADKNGFVTYTATYKDGKFLIGNSLPKFYKGDQITFVPGKRTDKPKGTEIPVGVTPDQPKAEAPAAQGSINEDLGRAQEDLGQLKQELQPHLARQQEDLKASHERQKYFLDKNLFNDVRFELKDKALIAAVGNKEVWRDAWNNDKINSIRTFKHIVMSEPLLKEVMSEPEKIRTALQEAIATGRDDRLYVSDIINVIFAKNNVRMPSYSVKAEGKAVDMFNKQQNPLAGEFTKEKSAQYEKYGATELRDMAKGFAKALGVYEAAKVNYLDTRKDQAKMIIHFPFEGSLYGAEFTKDNGLQILQYPDNKPYYNQNGYSNGIKRYTKEGYTRDDKWDTEDLISGKSDIKNWFREAVTPKVNYDNVREEHQKFFLKNGQPNPKYAYRPDLANYHRDLVIASNRIGYAVQSSKLRPKSEYEQATLRQAQRLENEKLGTWKFYIDRVFPSFDKSTTWADAANGTPTEYNQTEVSMARSGESARHEFIKILEKNNGIDEKGAIKPDVMFGQFNKLLEKGLSRLVVLYPNKNERAQKEKQILNVLGVQKGQDGLITVNISQNEWMNVLTDANKASVLSPVLQQGLVKDIDQQETQKQENLEKSWKQAREYYEKLPEADRKNFEKTIREELKKAGVPENELNKHVQATVEKAIPVMPFLGADLGTGKVGAGMALNYPIGLGENGKYGTVFLGGSLGMMNDLKNGKFGPIGDIHAGYETAKLGPISVIVSAGLVTDWKMVGAAAGLGLNIDLGKSKEHNFSLTAGLMATHLGFLPGIALTRLKDHGRNIDDAKKAALSGYGFDKVDKAGSDAAKVQEILKNPVLKQAVLQGDPAAANDTARILRNYEKTKQDLVMTVQSNYDPTGYNGETFGIGFIPTQEGVKFVFGYSPEFAFGNERKTTYKIEKGTGAMETEIGKEQLIALLKQDAEGRTTPEQRNLIENLMKSKRLIPTIMGPLALQKGSNGEGKDILSIPEGQIDSVQALEQSLNKLYSGINVGVQYDSNEKAFELKFLDNKTNTEYEIAVDPAYRAGGIALKNGKVYLATDFKPNNPLTLLRSDFEYPFPKEGGAHNLSILTITDKNLVANMQQQRPDQNAAMEIYSQAPQVLHRRGGMAWKPIEGRQRGTTNNIFNDIPANARLSEEKFKRDYQILKNSPEFDTLYKNLLVDKEAVPDEERAKMDKFAVDLMNNAQKSRMYKRLSNEEGLSGKSGPLHEFILKEWQAKTGEEKMGIGKLNLLKNVLADASFTELEKIKNPKERQDKFLKTLERTEKITREHFKGLIQRNHAKYGEGDPRRITMDAEKLATEAIKRAKTIDINNTDGTPVKDVDHFNTLAATSGIRGFRGAQFTKDVGPDKILLGGSKNYAEVLSSQPNSVDANLAKLFIESFSPLENLNDAEFSNPERVKDFLGNPLSVKVAGLMAMPYAPLLFDDHPEYRDIIVKLAAQVKNNQALDALTPDKIDAITKFHTLVQGIRKAEISGQKEYTIPGKPDFTIVFDQLNIQDGTYKRCANYTYWINENLSIRYRLEKGIPRGFEGFAGGGRSRAIVKPQVNNEYMTFRAGVGVVTPEVKPPEIPPVTERIPAKPQPEPAPGVGQETPEPGGGTTKTEHESSGAGE